jgi:hypothetical protein
MSELEVVKHTRNLLQIAKKKGHWRHKAADIGLEILIIVFAITLSLLVERWREGQQERKLEHNFLSSLRNDLKADAEQLKSDSISYTHLRKAFSYYRQIYEKGVVLNADTANHRIGFLYNGIEFVPASSRYEALKASGKLDVIENKNLQVDIVNLYQMSIPTLRASTSYFNNVVKYKLGDLIDHSLIVTKNGTNIQSLMKQPAYYNMINKDSYVDYIISSYHTTLVQTKKIIKEIEADENNW